MKNDKIIPGVILISIGIIFLLNSFNVIHFHWGNILHLWPIFLVIGGVNLIFAHNRTVWATVLKTGVAVGGICLLLFGNFGNRFNLWPGYTTHWNWDDNNDNDNDNETDSSGKVIKIEGNGTFNEAYHPEAKIARLNISGGGTTYKLSESTDQQFEATTRESNGGYELSGKLQDSIYVVNFDMKKGQHINWGNNHNNNMNKAEMKLNVNPEWDINVEAGAAKLDFDLTPFKVRSVDISGGAASFNLKLGGPTATTKINITTGAAEVRIKIPADAACSIDTDSGLSSNHFDGFNKTDDSHYQTANFNSSAKKIIIKLDGGLSDFKVSRY